MIEPRWITLAKKLQGLKEIKGAQHEPEILQMWRDIKRGGIKNDETPWCAAFVGSVLERSAIRSTRFESARSYLDWGVKLDKPVYGCIVVFSRNGGGHVGFVVGIDANGNLLVLGGNQSDEVNIRSFPKDRVVGYRYPAGEPIPTDPLVVGSAAISEREA